MAETEAGRSQQLRLWLLHVLPVPGFVQCVVKATSECATALVNERVFARLLALMKRDAAGDQSLLAAVARLSSVQLLALAGT